MSATIREVQRRLLLRHGVLKSGSGSSRSLSGAASYRAHEPLAASFPSLLTLQPPGSTPSHLHVINNVASFSFSLFSSAAALPVSDELPKTKKTNRSRDPITVTPAAAGRIYNLISHHNHTRNQDKAIGIRLGTKKRGCNGLSYTLDYAYENHSQNHKRDEAMEIQFEDSNTPGHGLKVFIEPMALMNVIGTKMDFVDDEMSSEFTFTNPNSKGECGCGESFNV